MNDTKVSHPVVSVLMATQARNLDYLDQALRSVLAQTLRDIEIVLIFDGCSQKQAAAALSMFSDPRLRPVVSKRPRGLPRCLNIAARLARAPLLARMDDDDRCLPNRLERQLAVMREGGIDVLGTQALIIDNSGNYAPRRIFHCDPTTPFSPMKAVFGSIFVHPSVMMRREWLLEARYDPKWGYGEDRELWVRMARTSRYSCIDEPLLEYRRADKVKPTRMVGVRNAYHLIWRYRNMFGAWVPVLLLINFARQVVYWFRIRFG